MLIIFYNSTFLVATFAVEKEGSIIDEDLNDNFEDDSIFDSENIASPKSSIDDTEMVDQTKHERDYYETPENIDYAIEVVAETESKDTDTNQEQPSVLEETIVEDDFDCWQHETIDDQDDQPSINVEEILHPSTSNNETSVEIEPEISVTVHVLHESSEVEQKRVRRRPKKEKIPKETRTKRKYERKLTPVVKVAPMPEPAYESIQTDSDHDIQIPQPKRRKVIISDSSEDDEPLVQPSATVSKSNTTIPAKVFKSPEPEPTHTKDKPPKVKKGREPKKKRGRPKVNKDKSGPVVDLKGRGRKTIIPLDGEITKKVFSQMPTEKSIESSVPYNEIISNVLIANTTAKQGRKRNGVDEFAEEKKEIRKKLESMKVFKCGSCTFNVTKHHWREHYIDHGGICWIDVIETPYDITNWNESLRRIINAFKLYKIDSILCPNCYQEKKSAMGHLSHILQCAETEEVIEQRKQACELCEMKVLPYNMSFHRTKCVALAKPPPVPQNDDIPADQVVDINSFSVTGRIKRIATQKAETSFKTMANSLADVNQYIIMTGKSFKCTICVAKFGTKDEATSHVKEEHNPNEEGDFDNSESEVDIKDGESSESEGSSGVQSSDIETDAEFNEEDLNESSVREKRTDRKNDPATVGRGRRVVQNFYEEKTIASTRSLFDTLWSKQILRKLTSSHISLKDDVKNTMRSLKFQIKSNKFSISQVNSYDNQLHEQSIEHSTQLQVGQSQHENDTTTMFCGGAISSIDWAPTMHDSELDFLAVACNQREEVKLSLETTSISLIQIYQFKGLKEKSTERDCKLSYIFTVSDGPIWSIKFHPNQSTLESRIGLLAVTTANQNILIFTLPYLHDSDSKSLRIEPSLTCKLHMDDVLITDQYLYQATRVSWLVNSAGETYLCGGYINGLLALWEIDDKDGEIALPQQTHQAHQECITSLDIRPSGDESFQILTASQDRCVKTFEVQDNCIRETSSTTSTSIVSAAEWCINFPGFYMGHDDCFGASRVAYKQPHDFACRNQVLLQQQFTIKSFSINHWNNTVLFATASGDVVSFRTRNFCQSRDLRNYWSYCNFDIEAFTDIQPASESEGSGEEAGLVFCDLKVSVKMRNKGEKTNQNQLISYGPKFLFYLFSIRSTIIQPRNESPSSRNHSEHRQLTVSMI